MSYTVTRGEMRSESEGPRCGAEVDLWLGYWRSADGGRRNGIGYAGGEAGHAAGCEQAVWTQPGRLAPLSIAGCGLHAGRKTARRLSAAHRAARLDPMTTLREENCGYRGNRRDRNTVKRPNAFPPMRLVWRLTPPPTGQAVSERTVPSTAKHSGEMASAMLDNALLPNCHSRMPKLREIPQRPQCQALHLICVSWGFGEGENADSGGNATAFRAEGKKKKKQFSERSDAGNSTCARSVRLRSRKNLSERSGGRAPLSKIGVRGKDGSPCPRLSTAVTPRARQRSVGTGNHRMTAPVHDLARCLPELPPRPSAGFACGINLRPFTCR